MSEPLGTKQAAARLRIAHKTLYRWVAAGAVSCSLGPHGELLFTEREIAIKSEFDLTGGQAKTRLGCTYSQLRALVRAGRLDALQVGKGKRYKSKEVNALAKELRCLRKSQEVNAVAKELRGLTTLEVTAILRVHKLTVWKLGNEGILPFTTTAGGLERGGRRRYQRWDVEALRHGWVWNSGQRGNPGPIPAAIAEFTVSVAEASSRLNTPAWTINSWCRDGYIPSVRVHRARRLREADIAALERVRPSEGAIRFKDMRRALGNRAPKCATNSTTP